MPDASESSFDCREIRNGEVVCDGRQFFPSRHVTGSERASHRGVATPPTGSSTLSSAGSSGPRVTSEKENTTRPSPVISPHVQDDEDAAHRGTATSWGGASRSWGKMEMRQRLLELQEWNEATMPPEKQMTSTKKMFQELRRAAKKKADLVTYCVDRLRLELTGNETIGQLETKGVKKIYEICEPEAEDSVGFGKYSNLVYQDILEDYPEYGDWVKVTARENTNGESDPRLYRLAKWLETNKKTKAVKDAMKSKMTGPIPERTPRLTGYKNHAEIKREEASATAAASSDRQECGLDEMAAVIEQLKAEVAAARGEPLRKQATWTEDEGTGTDGSFVLVSGT